jgi:serine/threonine protein phosphatase 1
LAGPLGRIARRPARDPEIELASRCAYLLGTRSNPARKMPVRNLLNLFARAQPRACTLPAGRRVYAVGDIHGRRDLLDRLLELIAEDDRRRAAADMEVIFLGDLVDRGPDSRGVVQRLLEASRGPQRMRFLMGNHEEVFLRAARGDVRALRFLIRIGGRETLLSYGVTEDEYRSLDFDELTEVVGCKVPDEHLVFLSSFEDWIEVGDYLFVHAGLRPGVALADQATSDLYWIRDDFLRHGDSFGKVVVHGHSITEEVDLRPNRIGIDTGAFASGRLTAIGLEGSERWFLST